MTPASSERASEKFNPPTTTLRGNFHRWSCGRSGRSGRRSGRTEWATRCPVPRPGLALGPPSPPTRACAMDGSSAMTRIRTRRQLRVGERAWARWPTGYGI
eukprot:1997910-Pleurochrysis_carterae.AAC.2